jgi:chromosome segregation ATPase
MEENEKEPTGGMTSGRVQTIVSAALFVALLCVAAVLWIMLQQSKATAEAGLNGLNQNIKTIEEGMAGLKLNLEVANRELDVFKQVKTGLDSILGEFSSRVATVEGKMPEQEQEFEEFTTQMQELNRSVNDLANALAILRQERATQEQLAQAKEQLGRGIEGMRTSVKKLDKAQANMVYRVKKLEKFQKETGTTLTDLAGRLTDVKNLVEATQLDVKLLKEKPAEKNDFQFVPTNKDGGAQPAGEPGQPTATPEGGEPTPAPAPAPAEATPPNP